MRIVSFIGRLFSGILAVISGIVTLLFNNVAYSIFDEMSDIEKYSSIVVVILIGIFLIASTVYDASILFFKNSRTHKLKFHSKKFISFFAKWYGKPGKLSIICDDLDWIKTEDDTIFNKLMEKSKNGDLQLYLGKGRKAEIVKKLQSAGAVVFAAPKNIIDHYTFSCLSVMGNDASRIIVRTKHKDKHGVVIFDEINNTYVTELLNSLLKTMRR